MLLLLVASLLLVRLCDVSAAGGCEVCVDFLHRLYGVVTSAHRDLRPSLVEEQLMRACEAAVGKEARLCYYLGATPDAASRVTASVARPLASHVPVEKICQRLSSRDAQICQLTHDWRPLDLSTAGLAGLRVVELRRILSSWGDECRGCLEKHEFVSRIQERAPPSPPPSPSSPRQHAAASDEL